MGRLSKAFRRVLSAMSEEHWKKFWSMRPTVICLNDYRRVFQLGPGTVPVIYVNPVTLKWTDLTPARASPESEQARTA